MTVLRAVLMTGCVVFGLALAVMLLLAVVNLEPNTEEVIQAFRDEGLEVGETQQVDCEGDRSFVPKTYKAQVSFTIPPQGELVGGMSLRSSPRRTWSRYANTARGLRGCSPPRSMSRTRCWC